MNFEWCQRDLSRTSPRFVPYSCYPEQLCNTSLFPLSHYESFCAVSKGFLRPIYIVSRWHFQSARLVSVTICGFVVDLVSCPMSEIWDASTSVSCLILDIYCSDWDGEVNSLTIVSEKRRFQ